MSSIINYAGEAIQMPQIPLYPGKFLLKRSCSQDCVLFNVNLQSSAALCAPWRGEDSTSTPYGWKLAMHFPTFTVALAM